MSRRQTSSTPLPSTTRLLAAAWDLLALVVSASVCGGNASRKNRWPPGLRDKPSLAACSKLNPAPAT